MASVMAFLQMKQDFGQPVLTFIAQLKAAARICNLAVTCPTCKVDVDFTLYRLIVGGGGHRVAGGSVG
jgi:hypothetical protein